MGAASKVQPRQTFFSFTSFHVALCFRSALGVKNPSIGVAITLFAEMRIAAGGGEEEGSRAKEAG